MLGVTPPKVRPRVLAVSGMVLNVRRIVVVVHDCSMQSATNDCSDYLYLRRKFVC